MPSERLTPRAKEPATTTLAERERVVQALCVHFAAEHLSMEELEERLTRAYAARSSAQLEDLLADLPELSAEEMDSGFVPALAPSAAVPARGIMFAVMGGTGRKGRWLVPRHLKVVTVMGGAEVDLRGAYLAPGVTEIDVFVLMGGVEIIVPPGVRVETMAGAFMAGIESDVDELASLDDARPTIRVTGFAMMAGVEIKVRRPRKKVLARFQEAVEAARQLPGASDD